MKNYILFVFFMSPFCIFAQNIDRSKYQECILTEAFENRTNNPESTQYYTSLAHFEWASYNSVMGNTQVVFHENSHQSISMEYNFKFPEMNLPAASVGETCTCYRIDEVRSVRKLLPVGFTIMEV